MRFPIWLAAGAFLTGSIAVVALPAIAQAAGEFSAGQKTAVEKIVHDYLIANPEVIREAIEELEKRQKTEEANQRGKVVTDKCVACRGNGRVRVNRKIEVAIPQGISDGQVVRVQGEGEPPRPEASASGSGVRGDLHVVVHVAEDDRFERQEDDLIMPLSIGYAQAALGDVTFVDLPKVGATFAEHATFGTVESVKAASDLYCPVAGTIVAVNTELNNSPDLVNREPYAGAWMIRIKLDNPAAAQSLLSAEQYQALL